MQRQCEQSNGFVYSKTEMTLVQHTGQGTRTQVSHITTNYTSTLPGTFCKPFQETFPGYVSQGGMELH